MFYVYMVRCSDNSLYTGYTSDTTRRIEQHNAGLGAKYTYSRRPVHLVFAEPHTSKVAAMKREYQLKQLTKRAKEKLVQSAADAMANKTSLDDDAT